jgi:hypothetical protein
MPTPSLLKTIILFQKNINICKNYTNKSKKRKKRD